VKPLSLKFRLSFLVSLILLATLTTISIIAYVEMEESLLRDMDRTLMAMGEGILADFDEPESPETHQAEFLSITGHAAGRHSSRYRIWLDGGQMDLFASDPPDSKYGELLLNLPVENQPEVGKFTLFNIYPENYKYRTIWMRQGVDQGTVNILVAYSGHTAYHEMDEFLKLLLIFGGSMVLGALLLVPLIISWGMRPIGWTASKLSQITHKNIHTETLDQHLIPIELKPFQHSLQDLLSRLDRAMQKQKQFTANASHELRTPLTLIKSTLQTTRMLDREVEEYKQALDSALKDVGRMEKLTSQLLSLARIDETDELANASKISLDALLSNLVEIFDARASQNGGKVICEELPPVLVWGDESELIQLFSNLLENALQYGPPNGTVRVSLENGSKSNIVVKIHDEGGQIPPEALPHLFDRFYRADSSRSRATGGTGLGLAIAKEIVLRHHGDIQITSNPHTGTFVHVYLLTIKN
jgi:heavy metal sensor kinase